MADLLLKGGNLVNVFSGEIYPAEVAISKGKIAGLGDYEAREVVDVSGKFILPGFIDSHVHLESSMLSPAEFCRAVIPHGVTAVISDPHEIANVLGIKGLKYMLEASRRLPLDIYLMLPSCVPATNLETSGARLKASDLKPFLKEKKVLGLAELMNYPGVLSSDPEVWAKIEMMEGGLIDGHAPGLSGKDLQDYVAAGITSDHECISAEEAKEKLRSGMRIFIREGSSAKNLEALLPIVTPANSRFCSFATDDLHPADLKTGSINLLVKKAVSLGLDPVTAVQMATINPAQYFGLKKVGAVAPGYFADLLVIDNFQNFNVEMVFKAGELIAKDGEALTSSRISFRGDVKGSVKIKPIRLEDLRLKAKTSKARIIELIPGQIVTRQLILPILSKDGFLVSDTRSDILKLAVIERHKASGNIGFGLVKGFGLKAGALASSVAHDSHNLIAVGVSDENILTAILAVKKMQGGLVVVKDKKVLAELPLPIAGLMSDRPLNFVLERLSKIDQAVRSLGIEIEYPFSILSFLALPVIPELKLTDKGLVDVKQFKIVELFV